MLFLPTRFVQAIAGVGSRLCRNIVVCYCSGCCVQFLQIVVFESSGLPRFAAGFDRCWCRQRKSSCDSECDRPRILRTDIRIGAYGCCDVAHKVAKLRLPHANSIRICSVSVSYTAGLARLATARIPSQDMHARAFADGSIHWGLLVLTLVCTCKLAPFVSRACRRRKSSCRHMSKHHDALHPWVNSDGMRCPHPWVSIS